jgi:hypothetical protein
MRQNWTNTKIPTKAFAITVFLLSRTIGMSQRVPAVGPPVESEHRHGPNGWEGWTLDYAIPGYSGEKFPMTLVLAQHGRVVRRITDEPFIWRWIFVAGGRQVAYETGPLHFSMDCVLVDTGTGKKLADYDCYRELPAEAPGWVSQLEASK